MRLDRSRQLWLLSLLASLFGLILEGYRFGAADQGIHIPFLLRLLDGTAFPGDPMVDSAPHHPSFFWLAQVPLASLLPLPLLYGVLHLASLICLARGILALSERLFGNLRAGALAAFSLTHGWFAWGGAATWDSLFLPRTAVLPGEILALWLFLGRREGMAFALLGVLASFHATSACQLAVALAVGWGWECRKEGLGGRPPWAALAFLPGASPLLWKMAEGMGNSASRVWDRVDPAWEEVLRYRMGHHLFPSTWSPGEWASGALMLAVMAVGWRANLPPARWTPGTRLRGTVVGILLLAVGLGTVGSEVLPVAGFLQLHPWEAMRFLSILAVLGACVVAVQTRPVDGAAAGIRYILGGALLFGCLPLAALGGSLILLWSRQGVLEVRTGRRVILALWGILLLGGVTIRRMFPLFIDFSEKNGSLLREAMAGLEASGLLAVLDIGVFGGLILGVGVILALRWRSRREGDRREDADSLELLGWSARTVTLGWFLMALLRLVCWNGLGEGGRLSASDEPVVFQPLGAVSDARDLEDVVRQTVAPWEKVLVPPYRMEEFRVFARRSPVVSFKEGGECLYDRRFALSFRQRLAEHAGGKDPFAGIPLQGRGREAIFSDIRQRSEAGWNALSASQMEELGRRHGAPWVVMERFDSTAAFPAEVASLVYRNDRYQLLRLARIQPSPPQ